MNPTQLPSPLGRILEAGAVALAQGLVAWSLEALKARSRKESPMITPIPAQPQGQLTVSVRLIDPPSTPRDERDSSPPAPRPADPEPSAGDPRERHTTVPERRRRSGPATNRVQRPL